MYDPLLGRFLSPDNFVQMPDFTQSYNRYAYCLNNPLKFTDPSGEEPITIGAIAIAAAIGAGVGAVSYTASVAMSPGGFSNWNWGQFAKSTIIGGISGAVTCGIGYAFQSFNPGFFTEVARGFAHGVAQGMIAGMTGGDFLTAFASSAAGSWMNSGVLALKGDMGSMLAAGAVVGGITAELTGGDFFYGAGLSVMNGLLNHEFAKVAAMLQKIWCRPTPVVDKSASAGINDYPGGSYLRSSDVSVTFDANADNMVNPSLNKYFGTIMSEASEQGINSVNISCTTAHPSNASRSAHTKDNGARALDINYVNGSHVSSSNPNVEVLQNIIKSTPGYLENYGPIIINKVNNGVVIPAPWARDIPGGHYDHIHISVPR